MVACDNRTLDSTIPPSLFQPRILTPVEKGVQTPGNLARKDADLLASLWPLTAHFPYNALTSLF